MNDENIHSECPNEQFCVKDNKKCCFLIKYRSLIRETKEEKSIWD